MKLPKILVVCAGIALLVLSGWLWLAPNVQAAPPAQAGHPVVLYFFWGDGCPHCENQKPFLEDLGLRYPNLEVRAYEVYDSAENRELFLSLAAKTGFEARGVPATVIGERYWVGYSSETAQKIEAYVAACSAAPCPDAGVGLVPEAGVPEETPPPTAAPPEVLPDLAVGHPVALYFFWGEGCPHCENQKPFLEDLREQYPNLEVRAYEVYSSAENRELFLNMAAKAGFEVRGVPVTIIGDRHWVGFGSDTAQGITDKVAACSAAPCPDAGVGLAPAADAPSPTPALVGPPERPPDAPTPPEEDPNAPNTVLTLPFIGTIDLKQQSLWVSTALIAFVDGFNPCSLWVLSILISLTLRTGSRLKVFLTGFVFLFITSLIYVLFIAGLFTMFTFISFVGWIQVVVALLALGFAGVNIKDYFWYKEGLSFTIADDKKPGIYKKMRAIMRADSLWAMLAATVVMSSGIAIVELPCTAGFPVLWTSIVSAQGVDQLTFALLLLLYMVIYLLDELSVFVIAVFTLKSSKLEEKHGRVLKLIGGMLMLTLALVMLIDPAWMNDVTSTLIIFAAAFGAAMLVLLVHRRVLPRFGIVIGTEAGIRSSGK